MMKSLEYKLELERDDMGYGLKMIHIFEKILIVLILNMPHSLLLQCNCRFKHLYFETAHVRPVTSFKTYRSRHTI